MVRFNANDLDKLDKLAGKISYKKRELRGNSGKTGNIGPRGEKGNTGDRGESGLTGSSGLTGKTGGQGERGDRGEQGLRGDEGDRGLKGEEGEKGIPGGHAELDGLLDGILKGDQGEIGEKGKQGLRGLIGDTGPQGVYGKDGNVGPKGETGLTGPLGPQGEHGKDGTHGIDGLGIQGVSGKDGKRGEIGPKGLKGPKGDKGDPAKEAEKAVTNIIAGGTPFMPRNARDQTTNPGITDDQEKGFLVGSRWWDTTNDKEYVCMDKTTGAAVWKETTGGGVGSGDVSGPITSTDEAIARWNGTNGETLQDTGLKISDTNVLNMGLNETINFTIENVNPNPAAGTTGRLVYLTTDNHLYLDQG